MPKPNKPPLSGRPPIPPPTEEGVDWANSVDNAPSDGGKEAAPKAIEKPEKAPVVEAKPWEAADVRADVKKMFNVRLSEPLFIKLKWLSERGVDSMHKIALEAIEEKVNTRITQLSP